MKKAVLALLAGGLLLPVAGFAGRLDGDFQTQDETAGENNEACIEADGEDFSANGTVLGAATSGCDVSMSYNTDLPHKASATALKGSKNDGTVKVSQSVDSFVEVVLADPTGMTTCALDMIGVVDSEKCKVSGSVKATEGGTAADTIDGSKVSVSCDLGENGANIDTDPGTAVTAPSVDQFGAVVASFDGRDDVKLDEKGKLKITHDGVPDTTTPVSCDD